ncbi:MAG: polysaccharide lyase [Proteobacteria bacterium]|nr:polysaccharide lyase [Pseudomonadota bacterium]
MTALLAIASTMAACSPGHGADPSPATRAGDPAATGAPAPGSAGFAIGSGATVGGAGVAGVGSPGGTGGALAGGGGPSGGPIGGGTAPAPGPPQAPSPCVDPAPARLTEITARSNVQTGIHTPSELIDCNMVPVGSSGTGYQIWRDPKNLYNGNPSYRFLMVDDSKTRVEFSALYVTAVDIAGLTQQQIDANVAAKSLYHYGRGMATTGEAWVYEYGLWLPGTLDASSKGIISQWHGVPDRTTVVDPQGKLHRYTLERFTTEVLSRMYFMGTDGYDLTTDQPNGYRVDQGGYPPMSLKVGEGYLYLLARADYNRVTDKTDRLGLSPPSSGPKRSPLGTKTISLPYMQLLSDLPKGQWIDMKWTIVWSEWAPDGSGILNDGRIELSMDGRQVLDWTGPIGNNDEHGTYFKYGIYKAGASGMEVRLAGFSQHRLVIGHR